MLQGNKGEWSEIYVLLKLLGDQKIFSGDKNLVKIDNLFYPIIKIFRDESQGVIQYEINSDVIVVSNSNVIDRFPIEYFQNNAILILNRIFESHKTFRVPEVERFLSLIQCNFLKAKSSKKTDIRILIHDLRLDRRHELGFSIKSQLGGDSTLLNAGQTTNFIYELKNFNHPISIVSKINSIASRNKIRDRLALILEYGGQLDYVNLEQPIFKNNLVLIDSALPEIVSEILKIYFTTPAKTMKEVVEIITDTNPLNYDSRFKHKFYEYKIKKFLMEIALGMMPSKVWDGTYDATGGYLVVKEDGEILCYHVYDKNQFEDYLFNNTRLETASSSRHGYGIIYQEGKSLFLKLNLQIRFM